MSQDITLVATVSAATSITGSAPLLLNDNDMVFVQALFSGTDVAGTAKIQASADNTTYTDMAGQSQSVASSGSYAWNITDLAAKYMRLVWTYSSGTGNITVKANIKARATTPIIARG